MSVLISLAAPDERWASVRTSLATTAKPRPCSPARAASTAAFSARMLVWNAMPSMMPTMSAIFVELSWIESMFCTTSRTTWLPLLAMSEALLASVVARWAFCALSLTVSASSFMLDEVSSSEAACCSVRAERSRFPAAICLVAEAISSPPLRTLDTVLTRLTCILARPARSWPISSVEPTRTARVKSPCAMSSKCFRACAIGAEMARRSESHVKAAISNPKAIASSEAMRKFACRRCEAS